MGALTLSSPLGRAECRCLLRPGEGTWEGQQGTDTTDIRRQQGSEEDWAG